MLFMGMFLVFAGLIMNFKTTLLWKITEQWTSKDGTEPSTLYLWNTRFGGIVCLLIGLTTLTASLLL